MFNRRKLFGFAVAAPFVAAAATQSRASDAPDQELMRLTQGNPAARMYLTGRPENEEPREVGLAVGKDGHLWLKVQGDYSATWKRIVVE